MAAAFNDQWSCIDQLLTFVELREEIVYSPFEAEGVLVPNLVKDAERGYFQGIVDAIQRQADANQGIRTDVEFVQEDV